jgi:crotonobetaine/carnitine-CoA ligase
MKDVRRRRRGRPCGEQLAGVMDKIRCIDTPAPPPPRPGPAAESIAAHLQRRLGDGPLLIQADGKHLDAAGCLEAVGPLAGALAQRRVGAGQRVAVLHPLSVDALLLWWAIDHLGAVYLPLNPSWPPAMLRRVLTARGVRRLLVEESLAGLAQRSVAGTGIEVIDVDDLHATPGAAPPPAGRGPFEDCCIVHNSGRPGIFRGVRASWRMLTTMGANTVAHDRTARRLAATPPCFMGTLVGVVGAVGGQGSVAVLPGLSPDTFWPALRAAEVNFASLIDPTLADLVRRPPSPGERDHHLRLVTASAAQRDLNLSARARFGISWVAGLAKTEACGAIATSTDPGPEEGVGRCLEPYEGRIVDAADAPVPPGTPGELVLRSRLEGALPAGYADDPEASAALWAGGWLHTGWRLTRDTEGWLHAEGPVSIDAVVERRGGYMFVADLEGLVGEATGASGVRIAARPGSRIAARPRSRIATPSGSEDAGAPVIVAWLAGTALARTALVDALDAALPAALVPDVAAVVDRLPTDPAQAPLSPGAFWLRTGQRAQSC